MQAIDLLYLSLFTKANPHDAFDWLRAHAPVYFNPEPDGPGFYALTRYDHVCAVARNHQDFISSKGTQIKDKRAEGDTHPSVHNADPPLHGKLRALGLAAFSKARIAYGSARYRAVIQGLITASPRNQPFDFVQEIAKKIPMIIFAELLGVPAHAQHNLVSWANQMSDVQASDAEQTQARAALFDYFRTLAQEKRKKPSDDVASLLVQGQIDGMPIAQAALDAYFLLLTVAGNETTRFLLSHGLAALLKQPEDFVRLRQQPNLIATGVEEMCRFVSPVMHMRRTTSRALDLFGTPVAKGAKIILWFSAANRDPAEFANPHQLLLERTPNRHVGFGVGAHFCIGAHLARLEAGIFWEEFSKHIQHVQPAGTSEALASNWFNGLISLPILWS